MAQQNWRIAPGDPTHVFFDGIAKPINCGTAERACLIAAAPDLVEAPKAARALLGDRPERDHASERIAQIDAALSKAGV